MAQQTGDSNVAVLGTGEMGVWNGQPMPHDAVYDRFISEANTYDWWVKAHRQARKTVRDYQNFASIIEYHDRLRGYCPQCQRQEPEV